jgi:hypothetical protein
MARLSGGSGNAVESNGSWNPNFTDASGTLAGITATGNYNRIGNMVFFCVSVIFNGYTNLGTGQYQFDLPFQPRQILGITLLLS